MKVLYWLVWIMSGKCCPDCGGGKSCARWIGFMVPFGAGNHKAFGYCQNGYHKETRQ